MLHGRRVVLCVTGGVAAYKSAYLASQTGRGRCRGQGRYVRVGR